MWASCPHVAKLCEINAGDNLIKYNAYNRQCIWVQVRIVWYNIVLKSLLHSNQIIAGIILLEQKTVDLPQFFALMQE